MNPDEPKMSERKLEYFYYMQVAQKRIEWEIANTLWRGWGLPYAWNEIAKGPREAPREKVTLYLDGNVMKFFRAMGRGSHARINDMLKVWMYARLLKLVHGPDKNDLFGKDGLFGTRQPSWEEAVDGEEKMLALYAFSKRDRQ